MQWDCHKKGFFAQILFSFEFGGTQPSPSGAFGKEFANGYWEIMWEIQPASHKLRGRRAARNTGINKRQKIFSKILRDFRSSACAFLPQRDQSSRPQTTPKKQNKRDFSSLYPPASPISLPTHIKFI